MGIIFDKYNRGWDEFVICSSDAAKITRLSFL